MRLIMLRQDSLVKPSVFRSLSVSGRKSDRKDEGALKKEEANGSRY